MNDKVTIAELDQQLSERGQVNVLDWLIDRQLLPYAQYEGWRYGNLPALEAAIVLSSTELKALLNALEQTAVKLKLVAAEQEYFSWSGASQPLRLSNDKALNLALARAWQRPEDLPQLDLFMDNSAVITENQVRQQLAARQFDAAAKTLEKLTALNPMHAALGAFNDLINYGLHMEGSPQIPMDVQADEFAGLQQEVLPLARDTLKAQARDYLAAAWRRLADNLAGQSFDAAKPELNQAFALSQIPDWQAVQQVLQGASLPPPPQTVLLARACLNNGEQAKAFALWGLLAEADPDYAEAHLNQSHPQLIELWDSFVVFDEHWPGQWFLAYLLISKPGIIHALPELPQPANAVSQAVRALVQAKLNDEDQSLHRAQLKTLAPAMLKCFMNKRDWYAR